MSPLNGARMDGQVGREVRCNQLNWLFCNWNTNQNIVLVFLKETKYIAKIKLASALDYV